MGKLKNQPAAQGSADSRETDELISKFTELYEKQQELFWAMAKLTTGDSESEDVYINGEFYTFLDLVESIRANTIVEHYW